MKLMDIIEKYAGTVHKLGNAIPIFKNPNTQELSKILSHGVIKCIITQSDLYAFDYIKLSYHDIDVKGLKATIFFKSSNSIVIEFPEMQGKQTQMQMIVDNNSYLSQYTIDSVIFPNETE